MRGSVRGVAALILAVIVLTAPEGALAQEGGEPYPPPEAEPTTEDACPPQQEAGGTVTCVFTGFAADTEVTVEVQGVNFAREFTIRADARGVVTIEFTVPCPTPIGSRVDVTVTGEAAEGGTRTVRSSFTVGGIARVCELPSTGVNITNLRLVAAVAILVGIGLVVWARPRRRAEHAGRVS